MEYWRDSAFPPTHRASRVPPSFHHSINPFRTMIIDLERFVAAERPYWDEFERMLDRLDASPDRRMSLEQLRRFHLLYERTSAALAKMVTFSSEPQTRAYLEHLVARGYSELHHT